MLTPQYKLSLEEIYLPGQASNGNYICENFIVYPQDKEKYGGFIFGIIELKATPKPEGEKIIQTIVNSIKEKYYQQILASPQPQRLNLETVLEYALQKANEVILEMMQIGYITVRKENLSFVIAVAKPDPKSHETQIFFTHHGLTQAHLLHKNPKSGYKAINIIDDEPSNCIGSQKLFSSTVAGRLNMRDRFCVTTETFSNMISAQQICKVCDEYSIAGTRDYLRAMVLNNASATNFATHSAIIIGIEKESISAEQPISQLSMNELISTTEHTEKLLMPTIALNLNDKIQSLVARMTRKEKKVGPLQLPIAKQKTLIWNKLPFAIFYFIALSVKKIGAYLYELVTGKRRISAGDIKQSVSHAMGNVKKNTLAQKTTIFTIGLVVVALITSIFLIQQHNINKAAEEKFATQSKQIKLALNDAEFLIIAQKENDSLKRVLDAEALFGQLDQTIKSQAAARDGLSVQITNLKNKLLRIEKLLPQIFTELSANGQPSNGEVADFDAATNQLVVASGNNLYSINAATKNIDAITDAGNAIRTISIDDGDVFALMGDNSILRYRGQKFEKTDFSISFTPADFAVYDNLYLLNQNENQIYKAKKAGSKFSEAQIWLKTNSPLNGPTSLSIDGNIFVVDSNNKIYKFYGGKMENFMDTIIEPKPQKIDKILTGANINYLYVFDRASKRIVVLDKEGELQKQYVFESLDDITDFAVNEKTKTVYLLSGSKIYSAALMHL
jgi:hypothetical protein